MTEQAVPHVVKAVKWNQPLYGVEGQGFFVSFRRFTKYIKLTFFRRAELDPLPPVEFKDANERAFHFHEDAVADVAAPRSTAAGPEARREAGRERPDGTFGHGGDRG